MSDKLLKKTIDEEIDLYALLGVSYDDSPLKIKIRYKKLILQYHPDKRVVSSNINEGDSLKEETGDIYHSIQNAYDILKDQSLKSKYDKWYKNVKMKEKKIKKTKTNDLNKEIEELEEYGIHLRKHRHFNFPHTFQPMSFHDFLNDKKNTGTDHASPSSENFEKKPNSNDKLVESRQLYVELNLSFKKQNLASENKEIQEFIHSKFPDVVNITPFNVDNDNKSAYFSTLAAPLTAKYIIEFEDFQSLITVLKSSYTDDPIIVDIKPKCFIQGDYKFTI